MSKDERLDYRFVCLNYTEDDVDDDFPSEIVYGGKIQASDAIDFDDIVDNVVDQCHGLGHEFDRIEVWNHGQSH